MGGWRTDPAVAFLNAPRTIPLPRRFLFAPLFFYDFECIFWRVSLFLFSFFTGSSRENSLSAARRALFLSVFCTPAECPIFRGLHLRAVAASLCRVSSGSWVLPLILRLILDCSPPPLYFLKRQNNQIQNAEVK